MNYKNLIILALAFILTGCNEYGLNEKKIIQTSILKYKNSGFALIYNDDLKKKNKISKKINNRSLHIFHKTLKKNSFVKIRNPKNNKSIIAEVISNNVVFSEFYNSVITNRIVEELSLNLNEPYIDLILISKNSTFIAKKAKMFDEERSVAEKAPVDGIEINDLNLKKNKIKSNDKKKFSYSIKIADFYYKETAQLMIERIKQETSIKNPKILKLSKTKYRVFLGPFDDIKDLKMNFEKIDSLNFENLEILRNV